MLAALVRLRFPPAPKGRFIDVAHPILFRLEAPPSGGAAKELDAEAFRNRSITMSSEHFVLYTEGGLPVAQRALEEAERSWDALQVALSIDLEPKADRRRLILVVISSPELYRRFAPLRTDGVFRPATSIGEVDLVLLRGVGHFSVLQHELRPSPHASALAEGPGVAGRGPGAVLRVDGRRSERGSRSGSRRRSWRRRRLTGDSPYRAPISMLLETPHTEFLGPRAPGLYSSALWLATALNSDPRYRPRLNRYIQSLARGLSSEAAWRGAFGDLDAAALERDYQAEAARTETVSYRIAWRPTPRTLSAPRALEYSEGHAFMAMLLGGSQAVAARLELAKAIELNPKLAQAYALRALLPTAPAPERRRDAERATRSIPSTPLGWVALGLALAASGRGVRREIRTM